MRYIKTGFHDVRVFEPDVREDERGWHGRWSVADLPAAFAGGLSRAAVARLRRDALTGIHVQASGHQACIIGVLHGMAYVVAVDLRHGSSTFGRWGAAVLDATSQRRLIVPEGFGHGLCALADDTVVERLATADDDAYGLTTVRWNDAALAIDWPLVRPLLSARDARAPFLDDIPVDRLRRFDVA